MEAGARKVPLVVVRRDLCAGRLEHRSVAEGTVADAERSRLEFQSLRLEDDGPRAVEGEDLAPARIDDGERAGRGGRPRPERRDPGEGEVERKREPARRREPEPQAGEAAGPRADDEPGQVSLAGPGLAQQLIDVLEHADGPGDPLSQHRSIPNER